MRVRVALPVILLALARPGSAQELATTIDALCRTGGPVLRVRAIATRTGSDRTQVRFAVLEALRGDAPATLLLDEPPGRACGRALHGVVPGTGYVAFLDAEDGSRLASSSSRALVALEPGLVEHVRALLASPEDGRVEILAAALGRDSARVRNDAALALQVAPGVARASPAASREILAALARALPSPDGPVTSLCVAAARTGDPALAELLVPLYLRGERTDLDRVVTAALRRIDDQLVARCIPGDLEPAAARRAADLAALLAPPRALEALGSLAGSDDRSVRVAAACRMLALGVLPDRIARLGVPPEDIGEALRRARRPDPFRSIEPRRIR